MAMRSASRDRSMAASYLDRPSGYFDSKEACFLRRGAALLLNVGRVRLGLIRAGLASSAMG
jgi:hypothetical protein